MFIHDMLAESVKLAFCDMGGSCQTLQPGPRTVSGVTGFIGDGCEGRVVGGSRQTAVK